MRPATGGARGLTLLEVCLSLALAGLLAAVFAQSTSGFVEIYRSSHAIAELSQKQWVAMERIRRELFRSVPASVQTEADGTGFNFQRVLAEGVVETADSFNDWMTIAFLDPADIPPGASLWVCRTGSSEILPTTVDHVVPETRQIYYVDGFENEPDLEPGDRCWISTERVYFHVREDVLFRATSGATDTDFPLVDCVSRFQASVEAGKPLLHIELALSREGTEAGGAHSLVLPTPEGSTG
ncbi:MAG: hypothetical protein AB1640_23110 [bacterium]